MIKNLICSRTVILLFQIACFLNVQGNPHVPEDTLAPGNRLLRYVDPTIGNVAQLLEPTRPTSYLPNQIIRVHPIRKDYLDDQISGFPLTVVSHRLGTVFCIRPSTYPVSTDSWDRKMPYDQDLEITRPWYYSTYLLDEAATVEFSPSKKSGIFRFSFPPEATKIILLNTCNNGEASLEMNSGNEISGMETWHGDVKIYMYGIFNAFRRRGAVEIENKSIETGKTISGKSVRTYFKFPTDADTVEFRYAISFVSGKQAEINYKKEMARKSFSDVEKDAEAIWSTLLSQIQVEG
ncbi:MAG TPA: glycoside hydrolase family 92 protein, partial [Puia sp.]